MGERIKNVQSKEYNGIQFRSTLEADTAETLDLMGIPYAYERRKVILHESFRSPFQKDKVRAITYTPDFEIGPIMLECKGFETPEWKLKKKLIFKYLAENEPNTVFCQIHDCRKSLLEALDNLWNYLGYAIQVTSKPTKKKPSETKLYDSIKQAMFELNLKGKNIGPLIGSFIGKKQWLYGYNWKLKKLKI